MHLSFENLESRQLMHGAPVHSGPLPDVDGDGRVGNLDFSMVLANYGRSTPYGDATGDGLVSNADFSSVIAGWGQKPHADDAAKHAEHTALMQLFNVRTTTAAVIHSGNWSDPLTWGGEVPAADAVVWVPAWYTLTVDGEVQAKHVRVDGQLSFAANSHLTVDTLIGSPSSHLDIDLPNADESARITFAGDAIDTNWDKFAISRGLVWHGSSDIVGAEKATWGRILPAAKGATQLTVTDVTGWRVGDRLVIGGASVPATRWWEHLTPENDDVRIVAIDGNVVTLDRPLTFAHAAVETQNPVVINMTRNVVFESASKDLDKRGHVMFMHNPDQHIAFAAFNDLGRTDKSRIHTAPDGQGGGLANPLGRYALHFHRTGAESQAVEVTGVAISSSPGWGLVNHDSNVIVDQAVSYDVLGSHYVTEIGTERGAFTNSVAIWAYGGGGNIEPVHARLDADDHAQEGSGFWLRSGDVLIQGNVAVGMIHAGFEFFEIPDHAAFEFIDNVTLQTSRSLLTWGVRFPSVRFPVVIGEDVDFSLIHGNFLHGGVLMGYSSCLEFKNNVVTSFHDYASSAGFEHTSINANIRYIDNAITGFKLGVQAPTEGNRNVFQGGYFDNREVNIMVRAYLPGYVRDIRIDGVTFGPRAAWNVEMQIGSYNYTLQPAYPVPGYERWGVMPWERIFEPDYNIVQAPKSFVYLNGELLHYAEQAADFEFGKLLTRLPDAIRYEPDGVTLATGASLNARGLYVGGAPLPEGEQYHLPKVRAVLVRGAA